MCYRQRKRDRDRWKERENECTCVGGCVGVCVCVCVCEKQREGKIFILLPVFGFTAYFLKPLFLNRLGYIPVLFPGFETSILKKMLLF